MDVSIYPMNSTCLEWLRGARISRISSMVSRSGKSMDSSESLPASIFEQSKMLFTS